MGQIPCICWITCCIAMWYIYLTAEGSDVELIHIWISKNFMNFPEEMPFSNLACGFDSLNKDRKDPLCTSYWFLSQSGLWFYFSTLGAAERNCCTQTLAPPPLLVYWFLSQSGLRFYFLALGAAESNCYIQTPPPLLVMIRARWRR